jgi:hypothetical protein
MRTEPLWQQDNPASYPDARIARIRQGLLVHPRSPTSSENNVRRGGPNRGLK